jgi:hypothetical protein
LGIGAKKEKKEKKEKGFSFGVWGGQASLAYIYRIYISSLSQAKPNLGTREECGEKQPIGQNVCQSIDR